MRRFIGGFWIPFVFIFALDQGIKWFFVLKCKTGLSSICWIYPSTPLSLVLVFNEGIAFSFLDFLGPWLKYLQLLVIVYVFYFLFRHSQHFLLKHCLALAFILSSGSSNLMDRFLHGGVVDYLYWNYYFQFPIFNLADVLIDLGAILIILRMFYDKRRANSSAKK